MEKMQKNELDFILNIIPRNNFEKQENELIKELYKYVFKDARSIKALYDLIFLYRKEIAEIKAVEIAIANENIEKSPK